MWKSIIETKLQVSPQKEHNTKEKKIGNLINFMSKKRKI